MKKLLLFLILLFASSAKATITVTDFDPYTNNALDLGDATHLWRNFYIGTKIGFSETTTPVTPDANTIWLYTKDDGTGTSRIYILDDAGIETDLTGGGGGATTLDALLDVILSGSPYTAGKVLRADGSGYVDAVIAHSDLSGVGTNIHSVIDTHLASTSNPHSVTAAQAGAVTLTGNETIAGIKTFSSFPLLPSSVPLTSYQAVHKSYVDAFAQSLEVKLACRVATTDPCTLATDFENGDTIDEIVLATGNRILIKNQADATTNGIYTVNASGAPTRATDYDATSEVQEGTYTFISEGTANSNYQFVQITLDPVLNTNDLVFTYLNKSSAYSGSLGVELVGADFRVDLLASGALGLTGNELKVNVDGSSIEIATNALQVKALGVTNTMLAGSIADSKLSTISTVNKVAWAAVNKTGSVIDDIEDVNAPTPTGGQVLTWDTTSSKWTPATISSEGVNAAVMDVDVYSSGTVDAKWTNLPAATTELFGNTSSRVKADLTYATYYRIEVVQTTAGYSTSDLNLQYSTDNVTYQAADTDAAGECAVGAGIGVKVGDWAALVAGAQSDVWLRIVGKQGNGAADPQFRQIRIQFKMLSTGGEAPANAQYVTLAVNGTLSAERVLTGTTNQITVTDGGAGSTVTLSLPCIEFNDSNAVTVLGYQAGNHDIGQYNLFAGHQAGYNNDTTGDGTNGIENVYIGYLTGYGDTPATTNTGYQNTGVGAWALHNNTTGNGNFGVGYSALYENTEGTGNIAVGKYALDKNTTGSYNTGVGESSLFYNQTGTNNVAIGRRAGYGATGQSNSSNTFIGYYAGYAITTGSSDIFLGNYAGRRQTTNSNLLIIDNQQRASAAEEATNALIYGTMAASPANQSLRINGALQIKDTATYLDNDGNMTFTDAITGTKTLAELATDPCFAASDANDITTTDKDNWNNAFGWGDHSLIGYLAVSTLDHHYTFTIFDPNYLYETDPNRIIPIDPNVDAAITISQVDIDFTTTPSADLDWNLYFADDIKTLANATLIIAINTVNGHKKITSGWNDNTVPANKAIYIKFDAQPPEAIVGSVKIRWRYD